MLGERLNMLTLNEEVTRAAMGVSDALADLETAKRQCGIWEIARARLNLIKAERLLVKALNKQFPDRKVFLVGDHGQVECWDQNGTLVLSDPGTIDDIPF